MQLIIAVIRNMWNHFSRDRNRRSPSPHLLRISKRTDHTGAFRDFARRTLASATSEIELRSTRYPITTTSPPTPPSHTAANMLASRVAARSARAAAPRFQAVSSRGFAEAAKVDAKPPVPLFGVDGTYASALVRNSRILWEWRKDGR